MKNLSLALIEFHKKVGTVVKNANNSFFKSKYADLNAYIAIIREPLIESGLNLIQMPIKNGLKTVLLHTSGESIESEMIIDNLPNDPQKYGSAITYFRRYMIASFLMLNAEDDDCNSVSKIANKKQTEDDRQLVVNMYTNLYKQAKSAGINDNAMDSAMHKISTLHTDNIKKGYKYIQDKLKEIK